MKNPVALEQEDNGIAVITMQDTDGKNVFSDYLINGLIEVIDELENSLQPPVAILRGLPDIFSGGAEKETLIGLSEGKLHVKDLLISERLIHAPFPIIAAMEGHAVGGGLVMAVCCDMVIAARESRYGAVFRNMGFTPGMGCTGLLQELVGPYIANEMMLTGKRFKGRELADKGTNINYILPKNQVIDKAHDLALQIAEKNIKSVYLLKYALSAKKKKLLIDARVHEDFMHRLSFGFSETKERIRNFYAE
jgi:polyketide biosynthesis enoyl-CoA hydratase PksI